jgi:hypothetical protein
MTAFFGDMANNIIKKNLTDDEINDQLNYVKKGLSIMVLHACWKIYADRSRSFYRHHP